MAYPKTNAAFMIRRLTLTVELGLSSVMGSEVLWGVSDVSELITFT